MPPEWSRLAQAASDAIFDCIEADLSLAAITVDECIQAQVEGLVRFAESGRPGRVEGTRELVMDGTPYIAAYRVARGTIRILRVLHGAQQWPEEIK